MTLAVYLKRKNLNPGTQSHKSSYVGLKENMRSTPKVVPSILLNEPMASEVDVGSMGVEAEPSHHHSVPFCCRGQSDGMASDMEMPMKHRSGI